MKIIKNKFKATVLILLGVIIGSSITVYANGYLAKDIMYKKGNEEITVETALNELYNKKQKNMLLIGEEQYDSTKATSKQYDLSSYNNYQNISENDIYLIISSITPASGNTTTSTNWVDIQKNYNKDTGILTVSIPSMQYKNVGVWLKIKTYLYY